MLPKASNDGNLLGVFAQGVKLVRVCGLDLLTGNVRQLGLGNKRLGLGADELLLENDNLGRIGLLVLELGDVVGDLLLAYTMSVSIGPIRARTKNGRAWQGWNLRSLLG
jgi:hypothetical protein